MHATLSSSDYCSPDVFARERQAIFNVGWVYACHVDGLPIGTKRVVDVMGESVIVTRTLDGTVHAFANTCRHRGAELCERATVEATKGSIRCNYHSWTYGLDGSLLATPRVDDEFDRGAYSLWGYHADVWNGLVWVSLAEQPVPLRKWLDEHTPTMRAFEQLPIGDYRIGARTEVTVAANWKVIVENYAECLHCVVVHPELVDLIPVYKTGHVLDPDRADGEVRFAPGAHAFTADGQTTMSRLPGLRDDANYDGAYVAPNLLFDLTPTVLALTAMYPAAPDRTVVVGEYLFGADDLSRPDFDPSPEVDFNELVGAQDYVVCEMVQRGVSSPGFRGGALTAKDAYVARFVDHYQALMQAHRARTS